MSADASNCLHKVFTNDPILFKSYVNKKVTITTEDSAIHTGIVYTIDPVSESIVLMQPEEEEGKIRMKIIMRPAVVNIECTFDSEVLLPEMFTPASAKYTKDELAKRLNSVTKLLSDNHFPVTEDKGVLRIRDTVQIQPPYRPENCICQNSIILNRIQSLLGRISD